MKTKLLFGIAIMASILFNSCAKDGATGPAGPAGNANVQQNTYAVTTGDWSNVQTNDFSYNTTLGVPTTDQVSVYWSENGSTYFPLPSTNALVTGDQLTYAYQTGAGLTLFYLNTSNAAPSVTLYVSVFVIPPAMIKAHPNTNWNNYNELQVALHSKN